MQSPFWISAILAFGWILAPCAARASAADDRIPVPTARAAAIAEAQIKDVFKADLAKTRPADRSALARKMLQQADETKNDPAAVFELLIYARNLGGKAGDSGTAIEAADRLCKLYQVKPGEVYLAAADQLMNAPQSQSSSLEAASGFRAAAEAALKSDEIDAAATLARDAEAMARRARNLPSILASQQLNKRVAAIKQQAPAIRASLAKLEQDPTNAGENLAVGRFDCFLKNDWDHGLGYLSLGSDATLKDAALHDLGAAIGSAEDKLATADAWYAIAATTPDPFAKSLIQIRAYRYYKDAISGLSGLEMVKAARRAEELQKVVAEQSGHALLDLLAVNYTARLGNWRVVGHDLVSGGSGKDILAFDYQPPEEYDIAADFTRRSGDEDIALVLQANGATFMFIMGGWHNRIIGAETAAGRRATDFPESIKGTGLIQTGQLIHLMVKVRKTGMEAVINGKQKYQIKTDFSKWDLNDDWKIASGGALGLITLNSSVEFHSLKLTAVSGEGKIEKQGR